MRISDIVASYILNMLDESDGNAEIKRNELADSIGCVPSQINYVLTSRFTPEQGYIVESRRGGGGFIRITRIHTDKNTALMHIVNAIGKELEYNDARLMTDNLQSAGAISEQCAVLINAAVAQRNFVGLPKSAANAIRASVVKNMLLTQI
ncbi:MAG: CtsR family transcriptional regulator [Acutalibacteraceae bacterium]